MGWIMKLLEVDFLTRLKAGEEVKGRLRTVLGRC